MSELHSDSFFAIVPDWVIFSEISARAKLLYSILSLHCNYSTRETTLGRKALARMMGDCSLDTIDRLKGELVGIRALEIRKQKTRAGAHAHNVYIVRRYHPDATLAAPSAATLAAPDAATLAAPSAALYETQENETLQLQVEPPPENNFPVAEVGGAKVTPPEAELATRLLGEWNTATSTRFTSPRYLASIVRRIREHPGLSLERHVDVIRRNVQNPWWKDDPTPAVIYGSAEAFEAALNRKEKRARPDYSEYN